VRFSQIRIWLTSEAGSETAATGGLTRVESPPVEDHAIEVRAKSTVVVVWQ